MEFTVIDGCLIAMLAIVLLFFIGANNQRKREQKKVQRLYDAVHLLYRLRVERHVNPLLTEKITLNSSGPTFPCWRRSMFFTWRQTTLLTNYHYRYETGNFRKRECNKNKIGHMPCGY